MPENRTAPRRNRRGWIAAATWGGLLLTSAGCGGGDANTDGDRVDLSKRFTSSQTEQGQAAELPLVEVYKSPTCGCCTEWVEHLRANGFPVRVIENDAELDQAKRRLGVPPNVTACHTAEVDGYVVEGHVPAEAILRLLKEHPEGARGLAVPGMPMGSPGMEGSRQDPYDVLLLEDSGATKVFESH